MCETFELHCIENIWIDTVEQEKFATGIFREFGAQASRVRPLLYGGNIREQEISMNYRKFAEFAKISCTLKFAVLQYKDPLHLMIFWAVLKDLSASKNILDIGTTKGL